MKLLNVICIVFLVLFVSVSVFIYSDLFVNFPVLDDYGALIKFNLDYNELKTPAQKLKLVFSQGNDHRLALLRVINLMYLNITGKVNFGHYKVIGLVLYLCSIIALFFIGKFQKSRFIDFLPVPLLMISFAYVEIFYLAMESISHLPAILFSMLTAYSIGHSKKILLPLLLLFVTVYANGNGILIIPLGYLGYFFKKDYKNLGFWALGSSLILYLYFFDFEKGDFKLSFDKILFGIKAFPIYLGGLIGAMPLVLNTIVGLMAICAILYFVFFKKIYKTEITLAIILGFYLLTYAAIAIKRSQFGLTQVHRSTYLINSIMVFTILYVLFYKTVLKQWLVEGKSKLSLICTSIIVCGVFLYQFRNYTNWINSITWAKHNIHQLIIDTYGHTTSLYKDEESYFNIPLVMFKKLDFLVQAGQFDKTESLASVLAFEKPITNYTIKKGTESAINLLKIEGTENIQNKYLTITFEYPEFIKTVHNSVGIKLENNGENTYFFFPINYKKLNLPKNSKKQYSFLLEKKLLKFNNYSVTFFKIENSNLILEPKTIPLAINLEGVQNDLLSIPILLNSDTIKTDTSLNVNLHEAFFDKTAHKVILKINPEKSEKIINDNYLLFENTQTKQSFITKLTRYNRGDLLYYSTFKQADILPLLKSYDSVYKMSVLTKKPNSGFYKTSLKSIYYFYLPNKYVR